MKSSFVIRYSLLGLVFLMFFTALPAKAAVIEKVTEQGKEVGLINWTMGVLMVESSAGPGVKNAEAVALNDAHKKLIKLMNKVRVTTRENVEDVVGKNKVLQKKLSDMVKKQMVAKVEKHPNGKVDVRAHLFIHQPTGPFELIYRAILKK